jgi:hypothetical protein
MKANGERGGGLQGLTKLTQKLKVKEKSKAILPVAVLVGL